MYFLAIEMTRRRFASTISFLAMRASRSPFWTWLTIRRNSVSAMPVDWLISAISPRIRSTLSCFGGGEGGELLVDALGAVEPAVVQLAAGIAFQERPARHAVALGQAQHLPAQRHQAPVVAVQLVDQIFDLGGVELDALDLGGELLAELVDISSRRPARAPGRSTALPSGVLDLGEFLVERGDRRELLERGRL